MGAAASPAIDCSPKCPVQQCIEIVFAESVPRRVNTGFDLPPRARVLMREHGQPCAVDLRAMRQLVSVNAANQFVDRGKPTRAAAAAETVDQRDAVGKQVEDIGSKTGYVPVQFCTMKTVTFLTDEQGLKRAFASTMTGR